MAEQAVESLQETPDITRQLAANVAALTGGAQDPAALPVAFGRACAAMPLPAPEVIAAFLQAQAAALVSAAVRFLPLGPVEGQRMLADLQPRILARALIASDASEDDLASAAWGADIAAMRHETMTTRIFRS